MISEAFKTITLYHTKDAERGAVLVLSDKKSKIKDDGSHYEVPEDWILVNGKETRHGNDNKMCWEL